MTDVFKEQKVTHATGNYCGVSGPTYETPAEVQYLRLIGGDAVGMSTVPEAIAANHLGLRIAALSCLTNMAAGLSANKLTHEEVTTNAKEAEQKFCDFLVEFLKRI
ncbi:MAG: purine-nucleoside phosphorylase, partial [Bdellovibrionales bacterium]|nr:purine-nucleoside phosphorylase [Bdellovibrionales bacterium]